MNSEKRNQILGLACEALQTEADALLRIKRELGDEFVNAVEAILSSNNKVIMTGMGKSGLVAKKIAATLASTGTPSFYMHPGEAFHGDLGMISKGDIVIALSYSGETDEVLKIVPFIQDNGNLLISMTGNPRSSLAKNSNIHLDALCDALCACDILRHEKSFDRICKAIAGNALDFVLYICYNQKPLRRYAAKAFLNCRYRQEGGLY